ncbi:ATPase [Burkholderia aenigmatica]|uniref:AAA family ATPase n=1 Tax=Burkholderia aenigmatica TaxID=2015348 RepID=UPI001452FF6A|nr:ATP-binding protein [Burkholderia aenigmatica]VWD48391.1 ATPase [Burkholderia aenigmatica]
MVDSKARGDRRALNRAVDAILANAREKGREHAQSIQANTQMHPVGQAPNAAALPDRIADLVFEMPTRRQLDDLILADSVREAVEEFIYEYSHAALLRAHSVEPRHTLLLIGAPGNGKTSLAEVIATELGLPLLTVRYDAVVDSFLGETSNRLRLLIDHAASNPSVLFFDEFDAVGKERGDAHETGEIKRVVSSLLVQMDRLPSHSIIICATNHPELLDRAVWRRFELKLEIPMPGPSELQAWFRRFEESLGASTGISAETFAECMAGESMSEVESFTLDVRRKLVLSRGRMSVEEAIHAALNRWQSRLKRPLPQIGENNANRPSVDPPSPGRSRRGKNQTTKAATIPQKDLLSGTE